MKAHYALCIITNYVGHILLCIISELAFCSSGGFVEKVRGKDFHEFVTLYVLSGRIDLSCFVLWGVMEHDIGSRKLLPLVE